MEIHPHPVKRWFAGIAVTTFSALLVVGCAADQSATDLGVLRLQAECGSVDTFFGQDASAWFAAAGFSDVQLGIHENVVSQLSRGQILAGVMSLSTVSEAILMQAQPLLVVGVLPEVDQQDNCPADEAVDDVSSSEADGVGADAPLNPYVIVTTRDVLLDQPDALRALLAAEAGARASTLGAARDTEQNNDESSFSNEGAAQMDELPELATQLGYVLSAERLLIMAPLENALELSKQLHPSQEIQ